jgi:hypothetical protein
LKSSNALDVSNIHNVNDISVNDVETVVDSKKIIHLEAVFDETFLKKGHLKKFNSSFQSRIQFSRS